MTDVVKIARDCRATLAAEIARLDDFIRMGELLVKYGQRLDRDPALGAAGSATGAGLADHDDDANFIGGEVRTRAGVAVTSRPISKVATIGRDVSAAVSASNSARDKARIPKTDLASVDPDHFAFDEKAAANADELVLTNRLLSDLGPVDVHIGQRLRQRRWVVGMSQQQLADFIGVKLDQIQNFETGTNRISVRCMWDIAAAIEVPVSYFFENLEGQAVDTGDARGNILTDEDALELVGDARSVRIA
jgi:transcriptional regulator with XRE-family HTH domain